MPAYNYSPKVVIVGNGYNIKQAKSLSTPIISPHVRKFNILNKKVKEIVFEGL